MKVKPIQIDRVGQFFVVTNQIDSGPTQVLYLIQVFHLNTETMKSSIIETECTRQEALKAHKRTIKKLVKIQPNIESEVNKEKCPLCDSPMVLKSSKYGRFFSCTKWPDCMGMASEKGKLNKKTIEELEKRQKEIEEKIEKENSKSSLETRLDNLDLA